MTKIESPVLRRLGPIPFWRGEARCLAELSKIYARATDRANRELVEGSAMQDGISFSSEK